MLTMQSFYSLILWVILCLNHISQPTRKCLVLGGSSFNRLKDISLTLYQGNSSLKISSGFSFDTDWLVFERQLFDHLSVLDLNSTFELEIRNSLNKMVRFKLQSGLVDILKFLNICLRSSLRHFLKSYTDS